MVDKEDNKEESNKQSENPKINVFGLNIDSGLLFLTSLAIGLGAAGFTWYTNNQKQQQQSPQPQFPQQQQQTPEEQDQLYREYIQNELRRRNQIRQQQEQQPLPLTGNNNHVYVHPPNQQNDNNIEVGALLDMGKTRNYLSPPNTNHYTMPEIPNESKAPMINMGIYRKRDVPQQQEEEEESQQQQQQDEAGYSNEELMNRVNNNNYY